MKNQHGCYYCYFYSDGSCLWFEKYGKMKESKIIPEHIISKGCSLYTTKIVGYLIDKFDGEFL